MEHKSNQKERRSLMLVSGTESLNGEVPVTPVKRDRSGTEEQVSCHLVTLGEGWCMVGRGY